MDIATEQLVTTDTLRLVDKSSQELAPLAYARARESFGYTVTYSPKVFIPLTKLCRDRCGYCTFAQAPARVPAPYLDIDEVLAIAEEGKEGGL